MLKISVIMAESFNESTEEFVIDSSFELELEHSLVSLSKWESEHEKPFLSTTDKTSEEVMHYIQCMIITPEYPPDIMLKLSQDNVEQINKYIDKKMTATWFKEEGPAGRSREIITSELIYYWIVSYQIPWEAQYWHLNRLFTLIRVFSAKNEPAKKRTTQQIAQERHALNEQRKAEMKSHG